MDNKDIIQGSSEWFAIRCGKITASKVSNVLMKPTTAGYRNYRAQLVAERLTNNVEQGFTNSAMAWGTEQEPFARSAYELKTGNLVDTVGFVESIAIPNVGVSPDGLVGDKGLIEIKCPNTATHIENIISQQCPSEYYDQVQFQLEITKRVWCDFVSFDPRMPDEDQLVIVRVQRDNDYITKLIEAVGKFEKDILSTIEAIKEKRK